MFAILQIVLMLSSCLNLNGMDSATIHGRVIKKQLLVYSKRTCYLFHMRQHIFFILFLQLHFNP